MPATAAREQRSSLAIFRLPSFDWQRLPTLLGSNVPRPILRERTRKKLGFYHRSRFNTVDTKSSPSCSESALMKSISLRHLLTLLFLLMTASASAFSVRPADGLWSVVEEQNLAVGRAFNLEVTGPLLVTTVYNYTASGAPTFYVGAAAIAANNTAAVALSEPRGGTCLGCIPTSGSLLSSPGTALFEFTSSTTGFVTLPKESRKAIFKGQIARPAAPEGLKGVWTFTWFYTSGTIADGDTFSMTRNLAASTNGTGLVTNSTGTFGCEYFNAGTLNGYVLCVTVSTTASLNKGILFKWFGDMMDGIWYYVDQSASTAKIASARRIIAGDGSQTTIKQADASAATTDVAIRSALENAAANFSAHLEGDVR